MDPTSSNPAPAPQASSPWKWILLFVGGGLFLFCGLGVGIITYFASKPEGGVRTGNQLEKSLFDDIAKRHHLAQGESVVAYYDTSLNLDGEEVAILTSGRVIYRKDGRATEIALAEVDDIQHHDEGITGDSIDVTGKDGTRIEVTIAPGNGADRFLEAVTKAKASAASRK